MRRGCRNCHLLESADGQYIDGMCARCRDAKGLTAPIGRPKTRVKLHGKCEVCGVAIEWLSFDRKPVVRRFCCAHKFTEAIRKRTRLDCELLKKLYVTDRKSTPEIARMFDAAPRSIGVALKRGGVTLRVKTGKTKCQIDGCRNRIKKIQHAGNGALYGTMCEMHWEEHRAGLAQKYRKRLQNAGTIAVT